MSLETKLPAACLLHHLKSFHWEIQKGVYFPPFLITGASLDERIALLDALSAWLLCEKRGLNPSLACGQCHNCFRFLHDSQVFLKRVLPPEQKETISIESISQLQKEAGLCTEEGVLRIIQIPEAQRLSMSAANGALKLLEEPPANWVFLLSSPDRCLPATLLSRCQNLRLKPLTPSLFMQALIQSEQGGLLPEHHTIYKLCTGDLGLARWLLSPEGKEIHEQVTAWIYPQARQNRAALFQALLAAPLSTHKSLELWIGLICAVLGQGIQEAASRNQESPLIKNFEAVLELRSMLGANVNRKLLQQESLFRASMHLLESKAYA